MSDLPEYRVDKAWLERRPIAYSPNQELMMAIGRLSRAMDQDIALLVKSGVPLEKMELRSYQDDACKRSLVVDGVVVRDYTITFRTEPSGPQGITEQNMWGWTKLDGHDRALAEAVAEWAEQTMNAKGRLPWIVINTPVGPVEVSLRK